jgi:TPR repeat protein
MNESTLRQLTQKTEELHEANDWNAVLALWHPYIEEGDLEAQFRLAYYYLFYSFDEEPQMRTEMEKLLRTTAEREHPDAVYWLSRLYPDNSKERDRLLLKSGELGSLEGQRDLGAYYATGWWSGPRDSAKAADWYRRAADRGHPDAQYNLGFMNLLGEGVPANFHEGLRLLRLAADQNELASLRLLAELHRSGDYGVPVDLVQVARYEELYRVNQADRAARRLE